MCAIHCEFIMNILERFPADTNLIKDYSSFFISEVLEFDEYCYTCYCPLTDSNVKCYRAFSLLMKLNVGDAVMVVLFEKSYVITSVLKSSSKEIFIYSPFSTHFKSPSLFVQSTDIYLNIKKLFINALSSNFIFGMMSISTKSLKLYSNYISSLVKVAVSHFNHRVIKNSGNDVLIADQIHLKATQLLRQRSHLIQINAESYVLVDGKKVLLG